MSNLQPIADSQWQAAFDKLVGASADRNWIIGRLGVKTSSGSADLAVAERLGYYYVSIGLNGEQGQSMARDGVGVAAVAWQQIWLRRENNELVICRASSYGGGGGGGGGASNLNALTDVTLSTPADGNTLQYNSATGQWVNVVPPGGPGGAPYTHPLHGPNHSGKLPWSDLDFVGSNLDNLDTRLHADLQGITADDHHDQHHVLATGTGLGADHSISGAAAGQVLRASGPTTAQFDVLQHTDLGNVLPDQHHMRVHDIITGDLSGPVHTVVGADFTVVGVHPANTLALLPTSSAPGAAQSVLRTDANGGIQLDTNLFYVDPLNNWIGFNRTPAGAVLDVIASSNADHTQRIKQKSGQTGRLWRIEDLSGNELIVLDSVGNLQSGRPGFVSGLTGWQITPQGNAEFNNIWARGELHATVFVKDEVHATGGTLLVATAGTLHDDAVINATLVDDDVLVVYSTPAGQGVPLQVVTTSGAFTGNELHVSWVGNIINVNDPPSGPGFYFQPGDVIRSKTEVPTGVTDFWLEVNSAVQNSGYSSYSVTKRSGTDGTLPKGSALVSYGKQGDGRILMTSDLNYAPYIDVFTTGYQVWTGNAGAIIPRMRMGRLDGIGLPGVSGVEQYGTIQGKDLSDANQGYFIASNLQLALYKVNQRFNNGIADTGLWTADGNLRIGKNVGADATTGLRFDAVTGDLIIGNPAGTPTAHFLRWSQSTGKLTVQGDLLVSDPATSVSLETMTNADNAVRSDAGLSSTGYAGIARDTAIGYSDARRITGVSGTWASPGTNRVSWTSLAVVFASPAGSSRSIAAPAAPGYITISTRTYLYVSMAGTGTMTMQVTTSIATVSAADNVLIAVCDPGDPAAPAAARLASITVVAGSTFISGGNIFTGSITAANIATGTITANEIKGGAITVTEIDPAYTGTITTAQSSANTAQSQAAAASSAAANAQALANSASATASAAITAAGNAQDAADANLIYGESRRVVGVTGTWTVVDGVTISWASLQVKFAQTGARTITPQTNHALSPAGRHYLYVDVSGTGTMAMQDTTSLSSLGVNNALIAVVDTGVDKASITVVAGSTYISGDKIMTGSIVAANIKASAITADKMSVQRLDAMTGTFSTLYTGTVEVDTASNIHSTGKTAYADSTAGFFLGWDTSLSVSAYKFDVGNSANYLRWNGSTLALKTNVPLDLTSDLSNAIFRFHSPAGHDASMYFDAGGNQTFTFDAPVSAYNFTAQNLLTINYATGLTSGDVIKVTLSGISNAGSDFFHYDRSGSQSQLSYSGAMTVAGSFIAGGQVIANTNAMRITQPFTPASSSVPGGNVGEIRWDRNFIYVWTDAGAWRRATLNIF